MDEDNADSTCANSNGDILVDNIEKLLEKKLKPLECKLALIEQKQDLFAKEQEKFLPLLHKVQVQVDDLVDQQESCNRKIKDEIYNVQDTLDNLIETAKDIKSYSKENLEDTDSIKDKVIKIHKHLKVQEVVNKNDPKPSSDPTDLSQILSEIKRKDNVENDISNLTNDIKDINDKINQMESMKGVLDKNRDLILEKIVAFDERMVHFEKMEENVNDLIAKKVIEVKKCIIEEANETNKILEESKDAMGLDTKIEMYNEGMKNLITANTKKIQDLISVNNQPKATKSPLQDLTNFKDGLEKNLTKIHFDSFKEMSKIVKGIENTLKASTGKSEKFHSEEKVSIANLSKKLQQNEEKMLKKLETFDEEFENLQEISKQQAKFNEKLEETEIELLKEIEKFHDPIKSFEKIGDQIKSLNTDKKWENHVKQKLNEILKNCNKNQDNEETNRVLNNLVQNIHDNFRSTEKNLENLKIALISSNVEINEDCEKRTTKIIEKIDTNSQNYSEILNSVEDLKQLTSSIPQILEKLPKMEKIQEKLEESNTKVETKIINEFMTALQTAHQESLEPVMKKFEIVENRFAVIRKYVKSLPELLQLNSGNSTQISHQIQPIQLNSGNSHQIQPGSAQDLKFHVSNQCRILGDSIAGALDKFVSNIDNTKLKKSVDELALKLIPMVKELKDSNGDSAKASVIEDQLQALATTILEPIEELKPLQEQLLQKTFPSQESIETLNLNQALILKELRKPEPNSTGWIVNVVEKLKKVQLAQAELSQKTSTVQEVIESLRPNLENVKNGGGGKNMSNQLLTELRQKVELISDLTSNLSENQSNKEDVKTLIQDVRNFIEHIVSKEILPEIVEEGKKKNRKRKSQEKSSATPKRNKF